MGVLRDFHFSFDELNVPVQDVCSLLGFGDEPLPEPFDVYLEEALHDAKTLTNIQGAVYFSNDFQIIPSDSCLYLEGKYFELGKQILHQLKKAEQLAFFICTAGAGLSQRSHDLLHGEDPAKGYVYDVLGTVTVEAAMDRIQTLLGVELEQQGQKMTNRYSPGYCDWDVKDQQNLFSFFPEKHCGITLNDSSLMHPVKSVSGVFGLGADVKFNKYHCEMCNSKTCIYRNLLNRVS